MTHVSDWCAWTTHVLTGVDAPRALSHTNCAAKWTFTRYRESLKFTGATRSPPALGYRVWLAFRV
jgi:hypothetical protein